eukprot:Lithocolla_globosa_v1_NODE_3106_length_1765_cov_9.874269.p1 type:complete len:252 gc:universal NODE_3106_length_1765_cov_9.874269:145-900(+)
MLWQWWGRAGRRAGSQGYCSLYVPEKLTSEKLSAEMIDFLETIMPSESISVQSCIRRPILTHLYGELKQSYDSSPKMLLFDIRGQPIPPILKCCSGCKDAPPFHLPTDNTFFNMEFNEIYEAPIKKLQPCSLVDSDKLKEEILKWREKTDVLLQKFYGPSAVLTMGQIDTLVFNGWIGEASKTMVDSEHWDEIRELIQTCIPSGMDVSKPMKRPVSPKHFFPQKVHYENFEDGTLPDGRPIRQKNKLVHLS